MFLVIVVVLAVFLFGANSWVKLLTKGANAATKKLNQSKPKPRVLRR